MTLSISSVQKRDENQNPNSLWLLSYIFSLNSLAIIPESDILTCHFMSDAYFYFFLSSSIQERVRHVKRQVHAPH